MFISTDRNLFKPHSVVADRMRRLSELHGDSIDSIVFSTRAHGMRDTHEIAPHVHAHPTHSPFRLLYGWNAIRVALALPRPDIISAQDPFETGLAALIIARLRRVPLAVEIHTDFLSPAYVHHSFVNRMRVLFAGFVLRRAQGAYAVSERIAKQVQERYQLPYHIHVLPIFVDISRFAAADTKVPAGTHLLWVGRLEPEKNPMKALDAFIAARRAGFDLTITFVGAGSLLELLKAKTQQEGVGQQVTFVGHVSDVLPYYKEADVLLVTSEYEGYGMVIVEALAAGVPVLSTDVGIAREAGAVVADATYSDALCNWLSRPYESGVLKLKTYKNEEEYLQLVRNFYCDIMRKYENG